MKSWKIRLRALPLRTKVMVTVIGGALALLGVSTYLSFRYWKGEALVVAEQQALLAAAAVREPVENALSAGQTPQARRAIQQLVDEGLISRARVYTPEGVIAVSSLAEEEGTRERTRWLPRREVLGKHGLVRYQAQDQAVHAFLPLRLPDAALLHVVFPVGPVRAAMDRGLKVGLALVVASLLAMAALLFTMLEREVVAPVRRVSGMLGGGEGRGSTDEIRGLARSVAELVENQQAAQQAAESWRRQAQAQAGLAEVGGMAAEMAHEFKRPLATIRTALEMMNQEYALDPRGERMMDSVLGQLDKLSETMRDLFTLARPVEFAREPVELREVLDGALMQISAHPATRGVQLRRDYGEAGRVCGDAHRLEQVALNLLLNAVEATPEGGQVTVRLRQEGDQVRLEVQDTGVGIPPEAVEKVLRPFYSTKPAGTGLGLSLVARIVEAHGGRLSIDSQPGQGTRVRVELPTAIQRPEDDRQEPVWLTHASS